MKITLPQALDAIKSKVCIMGVVNVTPDSFSDGGDYLDKDDAIGRAIRIEAEGADIIDIGGESTRPGAEDISAETEWQRIGPVIEGLSGKVGIPISVDTRKAEVAEKALKCGVKIINDVSGLCQDNRMARVVAKYNAHLIVMHMKGSPKNMQDGPLYNDLISEISTSLNESIECAERAGVGKDRIIIDPGIGFGKTLEHNLEILRRLSEFKKFGRPICVGLSRKSFIGKILGMTEPRDRLWGTIAANIVAVFKGANILRVHDVRETADALKVMSKITGSG